MASQYGSQIEMSQINQYNQQMCIAALSISIKTSFFNLVKYCLSNRWMLLGKNQQNAKFKNLRSLKIHKNFNFHLRNLIFLPECSLIIQTTNVIVYAKKSDGTVCSFYFFKVTRSMVQKKCIEGQSCIPSRCNFGKIFRSLT